MKASKFSNAQKAIIIKQGEKGTPVAEACGKAGISQATHFNWQKKYAGIPKDDYVALAFETGVPEAMNHQDRRLQRRRSTSRC